MFKYLFGPVPSRRLGMSLGVDLVPHKVCTLDCIYCECGPTTKLTTERKEYILYKNVIKELEQYFFNNPDPDYITFSGSGEPTLNSRIGDVLKFIKKARPDIKVAILTNGTLLSDIVVRTELLEADVVLPSLDAASETVFKRINKPFRSITLNEYIKGLQDFRNEYKGSIWLEVLILPGYNDNTNELNLFREAFDKIRPDRIQLNSLDRPGVESTIRAASRLELEEIKHFLNRDNIEIIAAAPTRKDHTSYRADIATAILETIYRRPCTLIDLEKILGVHVNEINKYLDVLESENKIAPVRLDRGLFYKINKS